MNNNSTLHNQTIQKTDVNNSIISNANKYQEQEYSNYIDSSDLVINIYKNSHVSGLEKYFLQIEDWLEKPFKQGENKPYVIEAEEGVGKKTLLVKWMEYHQQIPKKYPDIILSHFASQGGNNKNYFFAIYRLLTKLREALDIQQKVELLEGKLRKYFSYWLNHCSDKLQKSLQQGEKVLYDKIIIIIEGIDEFIDKEHNREANVTFWLPRSFPEYIRVIVTCEKLSEANQYFQQQQCQFLKIPVELNTIQNMIERHKKRLLFVNQETCEKHVQILKGYSEGEKNPNFYKIFLCTLIPYPADGIITLNDVPQGFFDKIFDKINYDKLQSIKSYNELVIFILNFYSQSIMDRAQFIKILRVFSIIQKGLTLEEIKKFSNITNEQWSLFIACFKLFILHYKGLYIMNNEGVKKIIQETFINEGISEAELHEEVANLLEKNTPNSIRKLEEQTHHLFMSKNYFKLKEVVSTIENFLLLFNPNNKYDLCRYWQILEEQGFDPVIEYNKAIEGFEMHYHPNSQDVFRIIVQISRFLKEFADFETYFTPGFRHPPVRGTCEELEDIGLLKELLGLGIFSSKDQEDVNKIIQTDKFKRTAQQKLLEKKQKMQEKSQNKSTLQNQEKKNLKNNFNSVNLNNNNNNISNNSQIMNKKNFQILSKVESLNVDIPSNKEQFHKHYENEIWYIFNQAKNYQPDDEDSEESSQNKQLNHTSEDEQHISIQKLREIYNIQEKTPSNYYYKRWLWIQFPWACISLKCDYSVKLKECFSSAIEYMSVRKEKQFTKQALKIAIEAKLKKQMMYKKTDNSNLNASQITQRALQPKNLSTNNSSLPQLLPPLKKQLTQREQDPFMLTHQYLQFHTLNKQMEGINIVTDPNQIQNTSKVLEKSKLFKEKSKNFDPIQSLQDSMDYSSVLPRLKNSIIEHSNREIGLLESQALNMKRELDHLHNENRNLAKTYKQLKISQFNQNKYGVNPEKVENMNKRIMKCEEDIIQTEEEYFDSLMQIERLKTILKVCEENKQQNEDWIRNLNFLLTNLKKMIRWEQEEIKNSKENLQKYTKIIDEYENAFQEKMQTQKNLISHIEKSIKQKENFDSLFVQTDSLIEQSAIQQIEKLKEDQKGQDNRKQQKDKKSQMEKSSKQIQEQYAVLKSQYEKVKEVLDIGDPDYYHSEKFQKVLAENEKRDDFKSIILSRQQQIWALKKTLETKQNLLETIYKAYDISEEEKKNEKINEDEYKEDNYQNQEDQKKNVQQKIVQLESDIDKKNRLLSKLQRDRLCSVMTIGTIQKKLKIQQKQEIEETIQFSEDEFMMLLDEKMNIIKEKLSADELKTFNEGNFDFSLVYKQLIGKFECPEQIQEEKNQQYESDL